MLKLRAALRGLSLASLLAFAVLCTRCAPAAESVRCRNDASCRQLGGNFHYCHMSHCVECVTHAACGRNRSCVAGACQVSD
jgi:hypothetical protein